MTDPISYEPLNPDAVQIGPFRHNPLTFAQWVLSSGQWRDLYSQPIPVRQTLDFLAHFPEGEELALLAPIIAAAYNLTLAYRVESDSKYPRYDQWYKTYEAAAQQAQRINGALVEVVVVTDDPRWWAALHHFRGQ